MVVSRHIKIFDLIAPIYGLFFSFQVRNYRRIVVKNQSFFTDAACRVLDIGCGTGALAHVLSELGHEVTGIDGSERMIAQARRLNHGNTAQFLVRNAFSLSQDESDTSGTDNQGSEQPLPSQKYDIVVASYVLHGLQKDQRHILYNKMKNLALKRVIIMDYNQRRGNLTSLIEWLEHGDYFSFIKLAETEMRSTFRNVQVIQTGKRAAWYICDCINARRSNHQPHRVHDDCDLDRRRHVSRRY